MMLDNAKRLISASARSDVPSFMVMDVMAAAARIEERGGRVIHMEVGQPAAPAPTMIESNSVMETPALSRKSRPDTYNGTAVRFF